MAVAAIHLIIHGRVQAVGYRAWVQARAKELNLKGWVRNRQDGTVETVLCGDQASVTQMRHECDRGPLPAHVVRIDEAPWSGETYQDFSALETA